MRIQSPKFRSQKSILKLKKNRTDDIKEPQREPKFNNNLVNKGIAIRKQSLINSQNMFIEEQNDSNK